MVAGKEVRGPREIFSYEEHLKKQVTFEKLGSQW
jgi:hypothetical protein